MYISKITINDNYSIHLETPEAFYEAVDFLHTAAIDTLPAGSKTEKVLVDAMNQLLD